MAEISIFAGNFVPRGYLHCDGKLLPISKNNALYSLLGTQYGGDGRTTFALPDLRGEERKLRKQMNLDENNNYLKFVIALQGLYPRRAEE